MARPPGPSLRGGDDSLIGALLDDGGAGRVRPPSTSSGTTCEPPSSTDRTGDADVLAAIPGAMGLFALFSDRAEVGPWARDAIDSGALDGHPAEPDVRGAWAVWEYWYAADVPATARALGYGDDAARGPRAPPPPSRSPPSWWPTPEATDPPPRPSPVRGCPPPTARSARCSRGDRAVYGSWFGDESVDLASPVRHGGASGRRDRLSVTLCLGALFTGSPSLAATRPRRRSGWRRDAGSWGRSRSDTG